MSRTFRRKHYEAENGRPYFTRCRKVNGFYTKVDYDWDERLYIGSVPTKQELYKMLKWAHGESSTNSERGASPWFRTNQQAKLRMHVKQELCKYRKRPDEYEIIISPKIAYDYFD